MKDIEGQFQLISKTPAHPALSNPKACSFRTEPCETASE